MNISVTVVEHTGFCANQTLLEQTTLICIVSGADVVGRRSSQASKVEVVRRVVHNLCVFAHQGIGVPVAMHTTVSEGVSAAATDGCWDAATSSPTRIAAAATASGLAPRRLLTERTEVPEQSITTYRTRRCIRVIMQVPKLRHEQRPKSQNLCKHFRGQCPPVLGLVPWLFLALLSSLYTG